MLKWVAREGELQEQNQKTGRREKKVKDDVVLNSNVKSQLARYLKLILVNFSPATFSYAHRIFLDKVRPDNFLLLVFLHT